MKLQTEFKKLQSSDEMNLGTLEKESAQYKEVQKNQRSFKTMQENLLKVKAEFDEAGAALVEKQKMYIENAKKGGTIGGKKKAGNSAM